MDPRLKRAGSAAAVIAGSIGLPMIAATPAGASTAINQTITCRGNEFIWVSGVPGNLNYDFTATVHGVAGTSSATITSISYAFTNAVWEGETGWPTKYLSPGTHNNVNVTYPVTRNSGDNLGGSGTIYPSAFTVSKGGTVRVQSIMDVSDQPDPSCTASGTLNWK